MKLPITEMLEEEKKIWDKWDTTNCDEYQKGIYVWIFDLYNDIIPKVRELELSLIEKAKEEERERIVGILEKMAWEYCEDNELYKIKEAITRINN